MKQYHGESADAVVRERYALSMERISGIREEEAVAASFLDYFRKMAEFVELVGKAFQDLEAGVEYSLEEWEKRNQELYQDILPENYEKSYGSRRNSNFRDTQVDIKDNSWSVEAGLRTCQNNSSSIRYGGKDISFIRKNGHILRGGERMQVKGLFLNYKKNRRLMQYFFKIRELV